MTHVVVLLGPPGSGKGTQASRLSESCSLPHVATGDLFREHAGRGSELGRRAKEHMDAGRLVPDELVLDMLFDRVGRPDCEEGYVLDGFPRTVPQAEAFQARLGDARETVVNLRVSDEVLVERAAGRLVCASCGNIHHRRFAPPARPGVCDACGQAALERRDDDAPEVVRERLAVYHRQTAPVVAYYEEHGLLEEVDGELSPDEVFRRLLDVVRRESDRSRS